MMMQASGWLDSKSCWPWLLDVCSRKGRKGFSCRAVTVKLVDIQWCCLQWVNQVNVKIYRELLMRSDKVVN